MIRKTPVQTAEELWDRLRDLSDSRKLKIYNICTEERKDAALTSVVIGLKCLNQVDEFGLKRLTSVSFEWGNAISAYYRAGGTVYRAYPEDGMPWAGDVQCDVDKEFADLSERRRRHIREYLIQQRQDAQWNAMEIGRDSLKQAIHYGPVRMDRLFRQWYADLGNFYDDRDVYEPRLKEWLQRDIGFIYENGKLESYRGNDNKPIRKNTAEKKMKDQEERDAREIRKKAGKGA